MGNLKIWIDLDNSPHVPFFVPILRELERRGHTVVLTARDCFQVCGLAERHKLNYRRIGKHYGANKILKILGTLWRSLRLAPMMLRERPDVSVSHGSRSLILLSSLLGIPTVLLFDYEHAKMLPFLKPELGVAPEVVDRTRLSGIFKRGIRSYSGLKEDVYVSSFRPDPSILAELNLRKEDVVVTIRPPATEAHYHNPESERLFVGVVEFLGSHGDVRMIILPRNEQSQRAFVQKTWRKWTDEGKILMPARVLDGLNLIWHSDLVVSGGGTMNREAAALGVPVYSIFRGKMGAVDRYLADKGRLTLIETVEEIPVKVRPIKRLVKPDDSAFAERPALRQIMDAVEEVIRKA